MTTVFSIDPSTGARLDTGITETDDDGVSAIGRRATSAQSGFASTSRRERAALLRAVADRVDDASEALCAIAQRETGLSGARLSGEVARASGQFRLFADVVVDGGYVEAMIDTAGPPGQPDVRRMLVPLGPVAVFGASNFPFAFSVLGGDTASALAAGCAVIVKAHPSHPLTSRLSVELLRDVAAEVLDEPDVVQAVYGLAAGAALVKDPSVSAATLTGSITAARALQRAIDERAQPIPFFAELGSVNPVVVLSGAARARPASIAEALAASVTGSGGQLCTKPGYAFVPAGPDGDQLVDGLRVAIAGSDPVVLLSDGIRNAFDRGIAEFGRHIDVLAGVRDDQGSRPGFTVQPTLLQTSVDDLTPDLVDECFGPVLAVVRYDSIDGLLEALEVFPPSLTITLHGQDVDRRDTERVLDAMTSHAGRIVFDGVPTGVRVSWAQHHGGPWPSTNSQHTSVGATAIRRFLRPIAYQDAPAWALPDELRDGPSPIARRIDGVLELPADVDMIASTTPDTT